MKQIKKLIANVITFVMVLGMIGVMPALEAKAATALAGATIGLAADDENGGLAYTITDATNTAGELGDKYSYTVLVYEDTTLKETLDDVDSKTGNIPLSSNIVVGTEYTATVTVIAIDTDAYGDSAESVKSSSAVAAKKAVTQTGLTIDYAYESHGLYISSDDNVVFVGAMKGTTDPKTYEMFEVIDGSAFIDLSTFSQAKEHVLKIYGDVNTTVKTFTLSAAPKKIKATYDPAATTVEKRFKILVDDKEILDGTGADAKTDLSQYQVRTAFSDWMPMDGLTIEQLEAYAVFGANLVIRVNGKNGETVGDATVYVPYSKEAKVKIAKKANAPKITLDPVKMTIKFPKDVEYRFVHNSDVNAGWTDASADAILLSAFFTGSVDVTTPENLYVEARTKAKSPKAASKIGTASIAKQVVGTTDLLVITQDATTKKFTLTPKTGTTVEYIISDSATPTIAVATKWTTLTTAKTFAEAALKDKYVVYRVKGAKATTAAPEATLASTYVVSAKVGGTEDPDDTPTAVVLAEGSKGTAGDAKITALTAETKYIVQQGTDWYVTDAQGAIASTPSASKAAANSAAVALATGKTEITGLENGKTYYVEVVKSTASEIVKINNTAVSAHASNAGDGSSTTSLYRLAGVTVTGFTGIIEGIEVSTGATYTAYSDSGFSTVITSIAATTEVYIKVIAEDGVTTKYFRVNIAD